MGIDKPVVGIDLGGTNMQIGVVAGASGNGRKASILGASRKKTKAEDGRDAIINRLVEGVEEACAEAKISRADLAAVGIGAPGAIDPRTGVVIEAVNLRWDDVPLADILRKRFGVPVIVDNDVNVAVYGENRLGAGENARDLLGVWIGTGIGGGLILNGRLYYGHFLTAGEIGHTIAMPGSQPGNRSLEHNCSRTAIVERLVRLINSNRRSVIPSLVDGDLSKVKSKTVAKAYEMGDDLTVEIVDSAADLIGIAVANAVTLLSLGRVVLGGGLTEAMGDTLVERVRKSARKFVFPEKLRKVDVVGTKLLDNAGVMGAALIAMDRLEEAGK